MQKSETVSRLKGKRVLVVDDEPMLRGAIAFDLKRKGAIVLEASSGMEAIEIVKSSPVDAVVSDVRMPNGNGIELLEQIRAQNPRRPVVLLITGFADINEADAMKKGAVGLMSKPFDRGKLFEILEASLAGA